MKIEYTKEFTNGPRHVWEREATINGRRIWDEKWCEKCGGWRRVDYFYGERLCSICCALDEWINEISHELYSAFDRYDQLWELAHPPKVELKLVRCACGTFGESHSDYWKCEKCWNLMQETEASLR